MLVRCIIINNLIVVVMFVIVGAAQMYENGVLAYVDVEFVADVHIRAFEDTSACGRYFCFNQIVNTEEEALKLVQTLSPLIPMPPRYIFNYHYYIYIFL